MRDKIFISYSHADSEYQLRLRTHLTPVVRTTNIKLWSDVQLKIGEEWKKGIDEAIDETAVAILLISPDFLASDFIANEELPPLLKAWKLNTVKILPVILKPCLFHRTEVLSKIQCANDPKNPLASLSDTQQDEIWVDIVEAACKEIAEYKNASPDDSNEDDDDFLPYEELDEEFWEKISSVAKEYIPEEQYDTKLENTIDEEYEKNGDDNNSLVREYTDTYYLAEYLLKNPKAVCDYEVYTYCHIDIHDFIPAAKGVLGDLDGYDELIFEIRNLFLKWGWEGDGVIRLLWFPPFLKIGIEDTWGMLAWYVKQSNNGMSFIASPEPIPYLENFFYDFISPDEDGYYHTKIKQVRKNVPDQYRCYCIDGLIRNQEPPKKDESHWIFYPTGCFPDLHENDHIKFKLKEVKELRHFSDKKNTRNIYISDLQFLKS